MLKVQDRIIFCDYDEIDRNSEIAYVTVWKTFFFQTISVKYID